MSSDLVLPFLSQCGTVVGSWSGEMTQPSSCQGERSKNSPITLLSKAPRAILPQPYRQRGEVMTETWAVSEHVARDSGRAGGANRLRTCSGGPGART